MSLIRENTIFFSCRSKLIYFLVSVARPPVDKTGCLSKHHGCSLLSKKKQGIFNKRYPDASSIFKIYCFISFSFVYAIAFLLITGVGMAAQRQMMQNAL